METDDLWKEYWRTGDRRLRNQLVASHIRLAYAWTRQFARTPEYEDVRQVALLALVQAVERFDPSRKCAFSTFAIPTISGSVKRYFRDRTWVIRPPRGMQERFLEIASVTEALTAELGRDPTNEELAERASVTRSEVVEAAGLASAGRPASIDSDDEGIDPPVSDKEIDHVADRVVVERLLAELPARRRAVVRMRYFEDKRQAEIARELGVSQVQVSRLLALSLTELREAAARNAQSSAA